MPASRSLLITCFIYNSVYTLISWIFNKKTDLPWRRGSSASRLPLDLSRNSSLGLQPASPPCRFSTYQAPIVMWVSSLKSLSLHTHTHTTHYTSFWSCSFGEPILLQQGVVLGFLCTLAAWATEVHAGWLDLLTSWSQWGVERGFEPRSGALKQTGHLG